MKWIAIFAGLISVGPFSVWFRSNPAKHPLVWMVVGFLVIQHGPLRLYVAPISWNWPGFVKGAELSILDFVSLAIYLGLPAVKSRFPFRLLFLIYMSAVVLSALQAQVVQPAFFYVWQTIRIAFLAVVIARATSLDAKVAPSLLDGMAVGLVLATGTAVWARFVGGQLQAGGSFGHQNALGLISHFVTLPYLAMLLAGRSGWRPIAIPVAGGIIALVTVSRATIALVAVGYLVTLVLSALRGWSPRKSGVLLAGVVAAGLMSPFVASSVGERLGERNFFEKDEERIAFEKASAMMLADHPLGVGSNNWVVVANTRGYSDRAGVGATYGSRGAHVHNVYWLVAAETGYLGLAAFLLLLAHPLLRASRWAWRLGQDPRGDILLGLCVALSIVYVHSSLEWLFVTFQVQYAFGATLGMIAGLCRSTGRSPARLTTSLAKRPVFQTHPVGPRSIEPEPVAPGPPQEGQVGPAKQGIFHVRP